MSVPRTHRVRRLTCSAAALALLLVGAAACGDDESGSTGSGTDTSVDLSLLGEEDPATGAPITIGLVADGRSDAMDSTSALDAGEATVQYVNEHLGGVNGHVLEVERCETGNTPTGASTCAVQMLDAEVDAVLVPLSSQDDAIVDALEGSGIPYLTYLTANPAIVANPEAFVLPNPFAAIAAPAALANERDVDEVGLVVPDVPSTTGPITALATPIYEAAGVGFNMVNVSPQVADMTPQIQQAINDGNEMLVIGGPDQFIVSAIRAMQQLGYDGEIVLAGGASAAAAAEALPGALEGVTTVSPTSDDPAEYDVQLYDAVLAQYAPDVEQIGVTANGFAIVLGFVRALDGVADAVDAPSILTALSEMPEPVDLPLGAGITFQCGANPVRFAPSVCGADVLAGTLDAEGQGSDFEPVDVGPYLVGG
jgi:branched-chain amino acid transport system substrate-binding protein